MSKGNKFFFDVSWVLFSSVVSMANGFALRVVLARWLGAGDLGLYAIVVITEEVASLIGNFGISTALVKYVAEYKDKSDNLSQINTAGFISTIILGLVAGVILYCISGLISESLNMPELSNMLKILAYSLPFVCFYNIELGLLNGLREMKTWMYLMIFRSIIMTVAVVSLVGLGFGVIGTVWGIFIAASSTSILGLVFIIRKKVVKLNFGNYSFNIKILIFFGVFAIATNLISLLARQIDTIMIGYYLTATEVGYYSSAVTISLFFRVVPQAIQKITFPATSEHWASRNYVEIQTMVDRSIKFTACILLPMGLTIGFFSSQIITGIFGDDFSHAALPLCILLIARVIGGSTLSMGSALGAIGKPQLNLIPLAVSVVTNIGLNALFVPRYGIAGAATATTTSSLLAMSIFIIQLIKVMKMKIDFRWFILTIVSTGIAVFLFIVGARFINSWVAGGLVLVTFLALIFKVLLTEEDRSLIKTLIYSLIKKGKL